MYRAIILARASDPKQIIKGDTLEDQIYLCKKFIDSKGWKFVELFPCVESGRKEEKEYFWKIYDYCKERKGLSNKIDYLVVKNLSRFTRGGGTEYIKLKRKLADIDVKIQDTYGTVGESINTLGDLGFEYSWSKQYPTEANEISQAENNSSYVKTQLTQMIGACIRYIQKGYWNGPAPYGLANKKTETSDDGIRNILEEYEKESQYIKRIYEMRADGIPDTKIAEKINSLGFKTRIMIKRDKLTKTKIGIKGGVPLTPKKIQEWIINPIYCGVIVTKWTKYQPVKTMMFDGLVDVNIFNRANRGKIFIIKNTDGLIQIKYNIKIGSIGNGDKRMRHNPNFPFKPVLRCPKCGKEVKASASKGRSGEKFSSYFCDRKHPRWHEKKIDVHKVVEGYIGKLKYSDGFIKLFKQVFMEIWNEKRISALNDSEIAENYVADLTSKQKNVLEVIKTSTSDSVRKALEDDYDKLEKELTEARVKRDNTESKEIDIKLILEYAIYLMEHPSDLLIDKDNMLNQRQMFGTAFEELPTYDDLVNGTAKLQPIFQLKKDEITTKSDLVQRAGVEPALDSFTDCCLTVRLPLVLMCLIIAKKNSKILP